jgi:hypothetical protein
VVATGAEVEPQDTPKAPVATDVSDDATEPADPPKKPVDTTPAKDEPKAVEKVTAGAEKDAGAKDEAKKDAGTDAKKGSDSGSA